MKIVIRTIAAIVVSGLVAHGTAQACLGQMDCQKSVVGIDFGQGLVPGATEVTTYPADVTYRLDFTYTWPNDRCAVAWLQDSLYGAFSFPSDPQDVNNLFWVYNPPQATQFKEYTLRIDSFDVCKAIGVLQADGTVTVTNNVLGAGYFGEDSFDCSAAIVCRPPPSGHGCTLTPGYWKTHSSYGPARYDATWASIGENTIFFLSGQTYYQVMWSDSVLKYYILARAYIAATLNVNAGASTTEDVDEALAFAQAFFASNTPTTELSAALRAQVIGMAGILDNYNNGLLGPGHCPE